MYEAWDIESANRVIYEKDKLEAALKVLELVSYGTTDLSMLLPGQKKAMSHKATVQWANAVISLAEQGRID